VTAPAVALRPVYPSEEAALKRAEVLKQSGIWPGAVHQADDRWVLFFDPEVYR
jgi:hypothetical protein